MSHFIARSVLACSLIFVLTACQSAVAPINEPAIDQFAVAEQLFESYLASKELDLAGQQLESLRHQHPDEQGLAALQQQLASAWLARGEQALKDADVDTASAALIKAKRLLPQAPALTEGLSAALATMQTPVVEPVAPVAPRPVPPPKKPVAKKVPVPTEPVSIPAPSIELPELVEQTPSLPPTRSKLKARILDVDAPYTVVPMPMLNSRNDHQLGRLLDEVAADVVKFRAVVTIEVADTRDFHWVAALLSARVKKLDANFKPRLQEVIRSDQPAQLVITPNKSL
ncbi:hypothetical protein [Denitrificimonas caeni]|uniref:hypothetical protein n=1 Tax=Denitrificimonas caeni TaxID=521720 RepID=UPI00196388E0|nr:hypothetical protein [Denitrificimonas caeni]